MAKPLKKGSGKIQEALDLFASATEARYRLAFQAYKAQDRATKNAIDTIRDRLATIATGYIRVFPHGKQNPSVPVQINPELVEKNILYMAVEIVKDLAFMDIQVANFEFPKVYCAECGEKLTPARKKVKK